MCIVSFFDSEIVRAEMSEISILQEDIYKDIFRFPFMSNDEKKFHISLLEKLLDKQKILYTRLSLSDDPEALNMKERMLEAASIMGFSSDIDMNLIFSNMENTISMMKNQLDNSEEEE